MKDELFIGINGDELIALEFDFERNLRNKDVSISSSTYEGMTSEEDGEEAAKERLADPDYWTEIGYLDKNCPDVILNNIDWDAVASDVISSDGWQNTNGEYTEFGTVGEDTIYMNVTGGGQNTDFFDNKNFVSFIPKDVLLRIKEIWDIYHIQNPPNYKELIDELKSYVTRFEQLTDRQFVINLYSEIKDIPLNEITSFKIKHLDENYNWDLTREINSDKIKKVLLLETL